MTIDDYLELPYHVRVVRDHWEDGTFGWFGEVDELPGCMTQGETPNELITNVRDAMRAWITAALEDGKDVPVPRPRSEEAYSGKFIVRVPRTLHRDVAHEAEREGVSLNQFVSGCLAAAVNWRMAARPTHAPA